MRKAETWRDKSLTDSSGSGNISEGRGRTLRGRALEAVPAGAAKLSSARHLDARGLRGGGRPAAGATVTVQPARDTSRSRHRAPHSKLPGLRRSPENSFDFECGCLDLSVRGASATQRFACVLLTQLGTGASMESSLWSLRGPQRGQARLQAAADLRARRIDGALARVRHLARPWSRSSRVTRTRNDPQGRREAPRDPRVLDRRALSFEATKLATASARALRAWLRRRP